MSFLTPHPPQMIPIPTPQQVLTPEQAAPSVGPGSGGTKSAVPSFLSAAAVPSGNTGQKKLLGA